MYYFQPTEQYIELLAATLSDDSVTIKKGDHWYTDVKKRILYYEPMSLMSLDPLSAKGVILHEIGHLKFTKSEGCKVTQLEKENEAMSDAYNCFEDIRIDERVINEYGAFASEAMETYYTDEFSKFMFQGGQSNKLFQFLAMSMMVYFYDFRCRNSNEYQMQGMERQLRHWLDSRASFDDRYGPQYSKLDETVRNRLFDNISTVRQATREIVNSQDISDVKRLVDQYIYPLIKDLLPEANEEAKKKKEEQRKQQQQQQQGQQGQPQQAQGQSGQGQGGDKEDENPDGQNGNEMGNRVKKLMESLAEKITDEDKKESLARMIGGNGHGGETISLTSIEAKALSIRHANTLAERIKSILKERACIRYQGNNKSGKLLNRNTAKIILGEPRAFSKRNTPDTPNYKLWLVLDASGSMYERGKAVSTFISANLLDSVGKMLKFDRKYIAFDNDPHELKNLDDYKKIIGGGTNDENCLRYIENKISPDDDNLIFIISDGDSGGDVRPIIKSITKKNSTVVGVCFDEGRGYSSMTQRYDDYILVKEPKELPSQLIKKLQKLIHR